MSAGIGRALYRHMSKSNAKTLQFIPIPTNVELPPVVLPSERTAWTSQSYAYGAYTTSAGVNVGSVVVKATVSDWNASDALDELERKLLAALADVRAHELYKAGF